MITKNIKFNSIERVKEFVGIVTKIDTDFDLVSGRYIVDAKSIMGIFSLDLSKTIQLNIHEANEEKVNDILDKISAFLV